MSERQITEDTDKYIVFVDDGVKYTVMKTIPPRLIVEVDFADPRFTEKAPTWEAIKDRLIELERLA